MATKAQYQVAVVNEDNIANTGVTFATNATVSSILYCSGTCATGLILPNTWVTSDISFVVSKLPAGPFISLTNFDGTPFVISAVAGSNCVPLQPAMFNAILYLQLVSSNPQTTALSVDFMLSPIFQGLHN